MIVTLKMKIQDQEFSLKADMTLNAGRIYRQQYQRDLIDDLADVYQKLNPSIYDKIDFSGIDVNEKTEEELTNEIIARALPVWSESRKNLVINFEVTERANQIIWAFAKNADKSLPGFDEWIDNFDFILPIQDIIPALYDAWNNSARPIIEVKN